jgi:hypothetical protein
MLNLISHILYHAQKHGEVRTSGHDVVVPRHASDLVGLSHPLHLGHLSLPNPRLELPVHLLFALGLPFGWSS